MGYKEDWHWAVNEIQPLAMRIYKKIWPGCQIIPLDNDTAGELGKIMDIGGADKLIRFQDGGISFLGQRFRRYENVFRNGKLQYDDFTLRRVRLGGNQTEVEKIMAAFERRGLVAPLYTYAVVNNAEDGFERFRIIRFHKFCQLWLKSEFLPDGLKWNPPENGKRVAFWYWHFHRFTEDLFEYNSVLFQESFGW